MNRNKSHCGLSPRDDVNNPSHYRRTNLQPIEVIERWNLPFHLGNVIKYVVRAGHKDPAKTKEDLKKAIWYLKRYIETLDD